MFEQTPERAALQRVQRGAEEDAATMPRGEIVSRDGPNEGVNIDEECGDEERNED